MRITHSTLALCSLVTGCLAQVPHLDPSVTQQSEAQAITISGQASALRDHQPWALSGGERIPVQETITTGADGYGHFRVNEGGTFDLFSNTRVVFRQNVANPADVLDLVSGRVRVHPVPKGGQQQRIFSPSAIISTHDPATLGLAVDEKGAVRVDVIEGEVRVQHTLLPHHDAVVVKAIDAIVVEPDEEISRRVDRGTLYRYTAKIWAALSFGHNAHDGEPIEASRIFADTPYPGTWRSAF